MNPRIPKKKPAEAEKKSADSENPDKLDESDEQRLTGLLKTLQLADRKLIHGLVKAEFDKDNDKNFHIDFITSCANMRAWNYHIPIATRHKCKMIAGKIIPAVATTTAMITGIVEMELYKLVMDLNVDKFCNSNINLAVSDFKLFQPCGPKGAKQCYDPEEGEDIIPTPPGFTCWDKVIIKGDFTIQQFLAAFTQQHYGCKLISLFFRGDKSSIWLDFPITPQQKETVKKNILRKISEIYIERMGAFVEGKEYIRLDGTVHNTEGKTAAVPAILLFFKEEIKT